MATPWTEQWRGIGKRANIQLGAAEQAPGTSPFSFMRPDVGNVASMSPLSSAPRSTVATSGVPWMSGVTGRMSNYTPEQQKELNSGLDLIQALRDSQARMQALAARPNYGITQNEVDAATAMRMGRDSIPGSGPSWSQPLRPGESVGGMPAGNTASPWQPQMVVPGGDAAIERQNARAAWQAANDQAGELLRRAPMATDRASYAANIGADPRNAWNAFKQASMRNRDRAMAGQEVGPVLAWQGPAEPRVVGPAVTDPSRYAAHLAWMRENQLQYAPMRERQAMVTQNAFERSAARKARLGIDQGITPQEASLQETANPTWGQFVSAYGPAAYPAWMARPEMQQIIRGGKRDLERMKIAGEVVAKVVASGGTPQQAKEALGAAGLGDMAVPQVPAPPEPNPPKTEPIQTIANGFIPWIESKDPATVAAFGIPGAIVGNRIINKMLPVERGGTSAMRTLGKGVRTLTGGGVAKGAAKTAAKAAAPVAETVAAQSPKAASWLGKLGKGALKFLGNPYLQTAMLIKDIQDANSSIDERLYAQNPNIIPYASADQQEEANLNAMGYETVPGHPGVVRPISTIGQQYRRPAWER